MQTHVFVAPFFMDTTLRFVEAAAAHPGTRTILVSQDPPSKLPEELRAKLAMHLVIDNALDSEGLTQAIRQVRQRTLVIDRLLGTLEHLQVPLARVREALGIPGMGVEAARRFRDKALMKDALRAAGIPCARHRLLQQPGDAWEFAQEVGFPLVVKPPAGVAAQGTRTIANAEALEASLNAYPPSAAHPRLAEELVHGHEYSFDGVLLDGELAWHSITRYLPNPLEVVENPWIQWCVLLPREVDDSAFDDIREIAPDALAALGLRTGVCHLEWFRRHDDGGIAVSEVGARPGGAQISKLMSYAHDFDFYSAWAGVMIDGAFDPPERRYAAGAAFLRGKGRGRVRAVHGLDQAEEELGPLVVESRLPQPGQPKASSYEGEGYVILRHPSTEVVERSLMRLISVVRVELG